MSDLDDISIGNLTGVASSVSSVSGDDDTTVPSTIVTQPTTLPINVETYSDALADNKRIYLVTFMGLPHEPPIAEYILPQTYFNLSRVVRWAATCEICPTTHRTHWHFFVHLKNATSCMRIKHIVTNKTHREGINVKIPPNVRGHGMNNHIRAMYFYCTKEDTRHPGTEPYVYGLPPPEQVRSPSNRSSKKSSTLTVENKIDMILKHPASASWASILHHDKNHQVALADAQWAKSFHLERKTHAMENVPRRTIQHVIVMAGHAGTGKTTLAKTGNFEGLSYNQNDIWMQSQALGQWFGNARTSNHYNNQRVIIIDEYHAGHPITFTDFKTLANVGHAGEQVQVKFGNTTLNHEIVIFTTNENPWDWFRNMLLRSQANYDAFVRRITKYLYFPSHRPDGTVNEPSHPEGPFYEVKELPSSLPQPGLQFF